MSWAYYGSLDSKINKILQLLISSQNLCKLLYYNNNNPLDETDISNTSDLIFKNNYTSDNKIFPLPKYPDAEKEKGSLLYVNFRNIEKNKTNTGFRTIILCISIACHVNTWYLDSGLRPFSIMHEVDKLFNNQKIEELSLNKILADDGIQRPFSDYFWGYDLLYQLSDNSNISCS